MSYGIHEPNSQIEYLRERYTRFVYDDCSRRLGSWEERFQQQDFHHFSTESCRGCHLIDGATGQAGDVQLPHAWTALMPLKTGAPGNGMEQIRDDLKQKKG